MIDWKSFKWFLGFKPDFTNSIENGQYGEWLGGRYVRKKGFSILHSNWRSRRDRRNEIDLICMDDGMLVFIEVRARSEKSYTNGYDSLNKRKRKALLNSFKSYLHEVDRTPNSYRFDLIEIDLPSGSGRSPKVFHHENIAIFNDNLH